MIFSIFIFLFILLLIYMNYKINYLKIETIDFKVQLGGMNIADVNSEVVSILEKTLDTNYLSFKELWLVTILNK